MIPNIFISSTIQDLSHLRDSIRDLVIEIGYKPVMSEYGDFGYLPVASAEESCYIALQDCQLAVFIIGKRYGSVSKNGISVTHNEFRKTTEKKIPIIFLIDEEVLTYKKVYDFNEVKNDLSFPGMENPIELFKFLTEFTGQGVNNGFVTYNNVQSAKQNLKKQIAHIVGDLLTKHFDPIKGEIKDILSEITTLSHILLKNEQILAKQFSSAFRFLIEDKNNFLKIITETVSGSLEEGIADLLKSDDFKSFLNSKGVSIIQIESSNVFGELSVNNGEDMLKKGINKIFYSELPFSTAEKTATLGGKPEYDVKPDDPNETSVVFAIGRKIFSANKNAEKLLQVMFEELLATVK